MIFTTKHLQALLLGMTMSVGLVTVTLAPHVVLAQTSKGTLTGIVRDSSGAVIVGASVSTTNANTGEIRKATTSTLGAYRLDALTPGATTLQIESPGFEIYKATNVKIPPSQTVSYDVTLKLGRVDQSVSVSADEVLLNHENASLSSTIPAEDLAKVPIFSLNPVEVLTTIPGVQVVSNSSMSNGNNIQVSGARPRSNNFMIDGQEINDASIGGQAVQPEIPDMYADTIVFTHNAPAEFGRASGGVVNMITKGGTNTFHGSAWELYSGSGLNAADGQIRQITPKDRANKGRYNQHQYGFVAGGPIIKNKLFGFGAAQWSRYYGNEQASQVNLPNADGIALLQTIAAGGNSTTATNAALLLSYLSNASYLKTFSDYTSTATSKSLGAACPAANPNCAIGIDTFVRPPTPELNPDTQWTYRIDYTPTSKDSFSVRYLHDRTSLTPDFFTNGTSLPGFDSTQGGPSELGQGAWTHIFTQNFLNEFRAAETRISFMFSPTAEALANTLYTAPNIVTNDLVDLGFNQSFPQGRGQDMYQFQDTISWTHGRQTLRAGADIGRRIETDRNGLTLHGSLTFAKGGTGSTSIGNFLLNQLGPSGSASRTFGNPRVDPHSWRSGIFAQDDVKLSPDLTINLGIRWDYFTNPDNALAYPAIDTSSAATLYGPINTVYKVPDNKHSVAPRIGFAFTPHMGNWFADGRTVIRGGFGIFFDSEFTNITVNTAANAPNIAAGTLTEPAKTYPNGLPNATGLISQIPDVVDDKSLVESVSNKMTSPYSPEWNLTIERELPAKIGISVTYAGSRGIKLFANQEYNYFDTDTGLRLNTNRGRIIARGNYADSIYNGLEVGARRNFSHGLSVNASYVYSKTLDDGSEVFTTDSAPTSYAANMAPGGRKQDWGNSSYDHRHYASVTYVWTPGGLHSNNNGINLFLGGLTRHWTISGTSRFQSGAYATLHMYGLDTNGDGNIANDRPLLANKKASIDSVGIDGSWLGASAGTYYDLAANNQTGATNVVETKNVHWLIPAYGNTYLNQEVGRNSYLTPGTLNNDIALEKALPTSLLHLDRGQFVLRAEVQNLANHNNVNIPTQSSNGNYQNTDLLNVGTSTFLNSPQARETSSRSLRFWAKFTF